MASDSNAMDRQRKFGRLVVEGLVIVISILMAFAIDAWWDERQEGKEWQRIQGQLRNELQLYRQIVPSAMDRSDSAVAAAEYLLTVIHGGQDASPAEIHAALRNVANAFELGAAAPVFELLAGTGGFALVPDPDLRQAISDITAFISLTREFEDIEGVVIGKWKDYLQEHYDVYGGALSSGQLPDSMPASIFEEDLDFLHDRSFSNLLLERRNRGLAVNRFRAQVLEHTETAIAIIDQSGD